MIDLQVKARQEIAHPSTLGVAVLSIILFAPLVNRLSALANDFLAHQNFAAKMLATHTLQTPHPLLQGSIIMLQQIFPISLAAACTVVVLISIGATVGLIYKLLREYAVSEWAAARLSVALLLVAPFQLFFPIDKHLYFGYIGINVVHSPTMFLLKPLALLIFGFAVMSNAAVDRQFAKTLTICALTTLLCAFAKPSFTIVILPSLALLLAIPTFRREVSPTLILYGILLPSVLVLGFQYWFSYSAEQVLGTVQEKRNIILAPLAVMTNYSNWLIPKLFLSILFPLAVFFCYARQVLKSQRMVLAWILFAGGASYTYLLAESGRHMIEGNFLWSGQIALWILFVVSLEFLLRQQQSGGSGSLHNKQFTWCMRLFGLHVFAGVIFHLTEFSRVAKFW